MTYLGLKDRKSFRMIYLKPLLNEGKLLMTLPDKPNSKKQKYVTKKGTPPSSGDLKKWTTR